MNHLDIGYAAGALTTAAWLPQLWRNWKMRSAAQISWGYLATFGTGVTLWMIYGFTRHDGSLIWTNAVTDVLVFSLIALKIDTRRRRPQRGAVIEGD